MKKFIVICTLLTFAASCQMGDQESPSAPMNFMFVCDAITLASTCTEPNTRLLTWIAPGDDGSSGQAFQYDIRYATDPMNPTIFNTALHFINEPRPSPAGTQEFFLMPRMLLDIPLSFGMLARDEVTRESMMVFTPVVNLSYLRTPFENALTPAETDAEFGWDVESIGDLDDTLRGDLAVGAPKAINPNNGLKTGAVMIYFNPSSFTLMTLEGILPRAADSLPVNIIIYGENAGDEFGTSIAGIGDINGDAITDFAIGAPGAGKVYIYLGGPAGGIAPYFPTLTDTTTIIEAAATADIIITGTMAGFGNSVVLLSDLNNNLTSEILIGSPGEGKAYLFYGGFHAGNIISGPLPINIDLSLDSADWTITGPLGSDFGRVVARVGIMSGFYEEMAISAPNLDLVYLFLGGDVAGEAIDFTLAGPQDHDLSAGAPFDVLIQGQSGDDFGASISALADLSDQGFASMVIGAPGRIPGRKGKVYVLHGGPAGKLSFPAPLNHVHDVIINEADITITASTAGTGFGESVTSRSDLNGDGQKDILVGAPDAIFAVNPVGAVYEFIIDIGNPYSRTDAEADYVIWGKTDFSRFGASLQGVAEMVSHSKIIYTDSIEDFIVGAPGTNEAYTEY